MILKIFNYKKLNRDLMSKMYKKVRDERNMEANKRLECYQRNKMNPKAFVISILTVASTMQ